MPLDQRMVQTHITIHTRKFHDKLNTEGAKRLKILFAIRRSIIWRDTPYCYPYNRY